MRQMSFALKTQQIREGTSTVTRRTGWTFLRPGEHFMAIEKGQGLKKGETVTKIRELVVVTVRLERLSRMLEDFAYGKSECIAEGFPHLTPAAFVGMFCRTHRGTRPDSLITRVEFAYVEARPDTWVAEPRCAECGFVMCEEFDYQRLNDLASLAVPTGRFSCIHCPQPSVPTPAPAAVH